ncbi:MAG: phosphatase PAP2 family protein [Eubacteriales bacterium]|nr:phosphatase PAP2 family protein [Eubacteriales bacterium]
METLLAFDADVLLFVQEHIRCGFLDPIMKGASWLGNHGILWVLVGLILLALPRTRREGLDTALGILFPWLITEYLMKNLIARPRPYTVMTELVTLVEQLDSFSFPSGHSCSSFAAATALFLCFRGRGGGYVYILAALIALSRVYVGVHYPTDVLVGAALGTLGAYAAVSFSRKYIRRPVSRLRETVQSAK